MITLDTKRQKRCGS